MSNNNSTNHDPASASQHRQKLRRLSDQHNELLGGLIDGDKMIIGSVFEVYKTCSKPNCCCQRGRKHGPFTAISYSIGGKIHHKMVREEDKVLVTREVGVYKTFQKKRKQLRQVQRDINEQLDALKKLQSREYQ
jgi:hypothetical protein